MKKILILLSLSTLILSANSIISVGPNGKFINPDVKKEKVKDYYEKTEEDETPKFIKGSSSGSKKIIKRNKQKKSVEDKDMDALFGS